DFTLVSIPMFVMMGAAIGSSPAGKDLYEALDRWLYRVPGGLVISNLGACAIFAALTVSSPACCAATGKMGITEMRRRGYPDGGAVRLDLYRRHVRPLRWCRDAVGSGGCRRRALRCVRGAHLSDVGARGLVENPARYYARVRDDPDDHRRCRAVRLHAHLA